MQDIDNYYYHAICILYWMHNEIIMLLLSNNPMATVCLRLTGLYP